MSIVKKCLFLIGTLSMLFSLSCKQKRAHKQVMAPVDLSGRTINIDWESRHQIIGNLGDLSNKNVEELDRYMSAFTNKVKYLPTDSLMPRIYPISDFSEHQVYSISWGNAGDKVRERIDTLKSAKGKIWRTTRWSSAIKGKVDFPERGVSFYMEVPFSYRFNCITRQYDYFPSQQRGSSLFTAISGPAFGELNYPLTEVMNIGSEEGFSDGFDGWALGELILNERRDWGEYADKKMKFMYGQPSLIDHNMKTTYKTSESFQVELTIRFKTPADVKNYNAGNVSEYANRDDLPLPIYIIIASGKFIGIHHN